MFNGGIVFFGAGRADELRDVDRGSHGRKSLAQGWRWFFEVGSVRIEWKKLQRIAFGGETAQSSLRDSEPSSWFHTQNGVRKSGEPAAAKAAARKITKEAARSRGLEGLAPPTKSRGLPQRTGAWISLKDGQGNPLRDWDAQVPASESGHCAWKCPKTGTGVPCPYKGGYEWRRLLRGYKEGRRSPRGFR